MNVTVYLSTEKKLNLVIFLTLHLQSGCFSARTILVGLSIINWVKQVIALFTQGKPFIRGSPTCEEDQGKF